MIKISAVLHLAADKYLAATEKEYDTAPYLKQKYSCLAIARAYEKLHGLRDFSLGADSSELKYILKGLRNMGLTTTKGNAFASTDSPFWIDEDIQGQRYLWLKWAALMAEEQGA